MGGWREKNDVREWEVRGGGEGGGREGGGITERINIFVKLCHPLSVTHSHTLSMLYI